jgi:nicotinamidase-related amidase
MNLTTANAILIVVDVQGKLARIVHDSAVMIARIATLIQGAEILGLPILVTEQYPKGIGGTIEELALLVEGYPRIEKDAFSCCGEEAFMRELRAAGRTQVLLCGIETHVCVYQTGRDLLAQGFGVHLVLDAVSSRLRENKELAAAKLQALGASLTGVEMALFEMLEFSGTDSFRAISRLVR